MDVRRHIVSVALIVALTSVSVPGFTQSQAERTGTGDVAPVAGQDTGNLAITGLVIGGVIAAAVGIAIAAGSSDHSNSTPVATVTSTTTR